MPQRTRRRFDDDDDFDIPTPTFTPTDDLDEAGPGDDHDHDDSLPKEPAWSTYPDAAHGPAPTPDWVITSAAATDEDLGVLKTGKEAEVSLLRRAHGDHAVLMAVKRYRHAHHRLFHRDAGYLEGRRVRKSREMRAMQNRTEFGREVIAGQWAIAEFHVLSRLWSAGAAVPYPVQLDGTELMMEFIGTADGVAAPRLAQLRPTPSEAADLYGQLREVLLRLAEQGYTHGDLSAYNILAAGDRLAILEAMKMEHTLAAGRDGTVAEVLAQAGDQVDTGAALIVLEED